LSELRSLRKLLVANRGEIALRVMKTAKKMGLLTVAVYTDADEQSPHVNFADQSVNIGKGPIADSYLSIEKIMEVALSTGCDAVHPGYGFLSENSDFAEACEKAKVTFVGPSSKAIEAMGNKAKAKVDPNYKPAKASGMTRAERMKVTRKGETKLRNIMKGQETEKYKKITGQDPDKKAKTKIMGRVHQRMST